MTCSQVFLFVPNVIGYLRILLAILSCYVMTTDYRMAAMSYMLSELLDAVDGYAARALNQSSRFGAMLDMLTDRCSTLCLLFALGLFYPNQLFLFQMVACVDIASHWLHMHSFELIGSKSHKNVSKSTNWLLYHYYTSRKFLFMMCAGNEAFFWSLYLIHFTEGPIVPLLGFGLIKVIAVLSFPVAVVKSGISLVHLFQAAKTVATVDSKEFHEKHAAK